MRFWPIDSDMPTLVTPSGGIVRSAEPPLWMGGRGGGLHRSDGSLGPRQWITERWDYCRRNVKSSALPDTCIPQDQSPSEAALDFLDEATALAAGHRPCEVRQAPEAQEFIKLWQVSHGPSAETWADIDQVLHRERLDQFGRKRTQQVLFQDLPDGCMFRDAAGCFLNLGGRSALWSTRGYVATAAAHKPVAVVDVLTPKAVVELLRAGYEPDIHESILAVL